MRQKGKWSLDRRLSTWLALQTFVGLILVSAAIYATIAMNLEQRQSASLKQKQSVVTHLLDEAWTDGDLPGLKHQLDNFFTGHTDLILELRGQDDALVYRCVHGLPAVKRAHVVNFSLASPSNQFGDLNATLSMDTSADDKLLGRLAVTLGAIALLGSLIVSVGGFLIVRWAHAPLQQLVDQTKGLAAYTRGKRLDGSAQPGELQPLVEQFNELLVRLELAQEQMQAFNSDVAHELNTPLSIVITSTELVLRKEGYSEASRDMLGSNLEDLHRMSGIIKDMLFLSQTDRGVCTRCAQVPSLASVAYDVVDYHEAALADANLKVEVVGDVAGQFDVPLIKRAISNLLGNATRYAETGSTIEIKLSQRGADSVALSVINRGPTIPAEHLPHLFNRFYRADPSRTQTGNNHGLGLAIVATIARLHGGQPFAQSQDGRTTIGLLLKTSGA